MHSHQFVVKFSPDMLLTESNIWAQTISLSLVLRQKHPPEVICKKRYSQKFRKIHRKTPLSEPHF